jgi:hypothetical protein
LGEIKLNGLIVVQDTEDFFALRPQVILVKTDVVYKNSDSDTIDKIIKVYWGSGGVTKIDTYETKDSYLIESFDSKNIYLKKNPEEPWLTVGMIIFFAAMTELIVITAWIDMRKKAS